MEETSECYLSKETINMPLLQTVREQLSIYPESAWNKPSGIILHIFSGIIYLITTLRSFSCFSLVEIEVNNCFLVLLGPQPHV